MATYRQFEDLPVWKKAKELGIAVYSLTKTGSFSKDYGFVDQIRRASVSISSNIAEGFERGAKTELIQFLYIAKGSCGEVRSQLTIAKELGYIDVDTYAKNYSLCMETSRQINGLIEYIKNSKIQGQKFYTPQDKSYAEFMKRLKGYTKHLPQNPNL